MKDDGSDTHVNIFFSCICILLVAVIYGITAFQAETQIGILSCMEKYMIKEEPM